MLTMILTGRQTSRGMTLVELLMVMAIFSVVMMAVISLFIPAVKSTAVQTQVTDVQSNLRLALNRMTQDLLTAGFLTGTSAPVFFEGDVNPDDPDDFTIRTRSVGSGFARVVGSSTGVGSTVLTLSQAAMVGNFPPNCKVRLFEPISAKEVVADSVYEVTTTGTNTLTIDADVTVPDEAVVIRIKDGAQPAMQTIRYQMLDGDGDGTPDSLVRVVNGETQYLARNLSRVNFAYEYSTSGRVNKVNVTLEGETEALGNDVVTGQKTRELQTSVTLRNTF